MKRSHMIVPGLSAFLSIAFPAGLLAMSVLPSVPLEQSAHAPQAADDLSRISLVLPAPAFAEAEPELELQPTNSPKTGPASLIKPREIGALDEVDAHGARMPSGTLFSKRPADAAPSIIEPASASPELYRASKGISYRFQLFGKLRGKQWRSHAPSLKLHLRTLGGVDWQAPIAIGPQGKYSVELVLAALPDQTLEWAVTGSGVGLDAELAAGRRILTDTQTLVIEENIKPVNP
jgi:hypothetical protein